MAFLFVSTIETTGGSVNGCRPLLHARGYWYGFCVVPVLLSVVPVSVFGLNGRRCQYFCMLLLIFAFVACVCLRPVFAAAILSFCCCGMSFL